MKGIAFSVFLPPTLQDRVVYGLIIGIVSCFQGMRTQGGTEGVGKSTTSAVVLSSLFIILADVVLVRLIQVFPPVKIFMDQQEQSRKHNPESSQS